MKPELTLLAWAAVLTLVQAVVAVQGALMQVGLVKLAGNRDGMPDIGGWGGRAARRFSSTSGSPTRWFTSRACRGCAPPSGASPWPAWR